MSEPATFVSCLTPSGTGAIAVLAVRGPRAWPVVREAFQPASKKPLPDDLPAAGTVWFGHLGGDGLADEVVVTVKQTTRQPCLEVHCHGGRQVVEWLIELFTRRGVQPESALQPDSAWHALTQAETVRTAAILLDLANGALDRALNEIRTSLEAGDEAAALRGIDALLKHARLGEHLTRPWNVVVAGAPNVGKSSLVNALAGYQRSVVAPVPGTTRDVVTTRLAIDGWPINLSDTAGLRDEAADLERAGIDAARSSLASADLILWVVDSTAAPVWPDAATVARNPLVVVNKTDQPAAWDVGMAIGAVFVSAQTGAGIPGLCEAISRSLVPQPPSPGDAVAIGTPLVKVLVDVRTAVAAGEFAAGLAVLV